MNQNLESYQPQNPQYILDDNVREEFPLELDFINAVQSEKLETKRDVIRFIGRTFTATFPDSEYVTRVMDDHEKGVIRGEYCQLVENLLPERKRQLEEALEEAKRMKKEAEERYASALQEVATMAAEVKLGTVEQKLKGADTFTIALAGYYLTYTWNEAKHVFVLAKGYEVEDPTNVFSSDENNRAQMLSIFGAEFPEPQPKAQIKDFDGDF